MTASTPAEDLPVKREDDLEGLAAHHVRVQPTSAPIASCPMSAGASAARQPEAIIAEARELVETGCKDITLLGQNVNSYEYGFASAAPRA